MTETREIKMSPRKMLTLLFLNYGLPWTLTALLGAIVFIVLGLAVSLKFIVLALLWVFLVVPLAVAFLYFYYGFEPLTTFNCMPHRICFEEDRMDVKIFPLNPLEEKPVNEESEPKTYSIPREDFRQLKVGADYAILFFGKKGWIWLPIDAFGTHNEMKSLLDSFVQSPDLKTRTE
ncbi:MAG: hypothetical protein J1D77_06450 [Muribaculaceae bacterium]|nr:hypothetical protein [Muribaculaceae bacterium]